MLGVKLYFGKYIDEYNIAYVPDSASLRLGRVAMLCKWLYEAAICCRAVSELSGAGKKTLVRSSWIRTTKFHLYGGNEKQ